MEIEIKTKSLSEIVKKCESLGWDLNKVKIETKIFEYLSNPDDCFVKMYLKKKK